MATEQTQDVLLSIVDVMDILESAAQCVCNIEDYFGYDPRERALAPDEVLVAAKFALNQFFEEEYGCKMP